MPIAFDGPYSVFVHCADDSRRPRPWRLLNRRLAHYLLVVSTEGEERITADGHEYQVAQDGAYLLAPGVLHSLTSLRGNRPAWVHFDVRYDPQRANHPQAGEYESELLGRAKLLQPAPREVWGIDLPVLIPAPALPAVASSVARIISSWRGQQPLDRLEAGHELAGLLLQIVRVCTGTDQRPQPPSERLARAEAVARRSLGADFGVAEFAAAAGYSRSRFSALYRRTRGIGPGAFLRRERLALAESLLARSDLPVGEVGDLVGYPDPTVFGRVFRAQHGMGPRAWRSRA